MRLVYLVAWSIFHGLCIQTFAQMQTPVSFLIDKPSASFFQQKRAALQQLLPEKSIVVLFSEEPHFYYLTGCKVNNALLLLSKSPITLDKYTQTEFLCIPKSNPAQVFYEGKGLLLEDAEKFSGIKSVLYNTSFVQSSLDFAGFNKIFFSSTLPNSEMAQLFKQRCGNPSPNDALLKRYLIPIQDANFAGFVSEIKPLISSALQTYPELQQYELLQLALQAKNDVEWEGLQKRLVQYQTDSYSLADYMTVLRQIKTLEEITALKKACSLANIITQDLLKSASPELWESELLAHAYFYVHQYGACFGRLPEIAGGENSSYLHYAQSQKKLKDGEWLRLDVAPNYAGWCGNVARSVPVNGKFSDVQKKIYDIAVEAHQNALKKCVKDEKFTAPHEAAMEILKNGLFRLGIIKKLEDARKFVVEETCSYIGVEVQDVGTYGKFKENQVITLTVSIFIPPQSECEVKWWNTGIRITDTVLITDLSPQNLTSSVPKTTIELEALMKQKSVLEMKFPSLD